VRAWSLEAAKAELEEAIEYYGKQSQRLGERFKRAVDQAIGKVLENPTRWPRIEGDFRRCRVAKFPYGVVYCIDNGELVIVAFMQLNRHPKYWQPRVRGPEKDPEGT
jgi:mRNA-degrading endonuclease RelE of RelBE toxin-antitoxin system